MHRRVIVGVMCLFSVCLLNPSAVQAQEAATSAPRWALRTRFVMTGVSESSDPEGYKVYSGIGLEVDVSRALGSRFVLSLTSGTQSREVELTGPGGGKVNLGSVEVLPIDVLVRYQRRSTGRFHPYVGGGIAFSVFWEKSGMLDSTDLHPSAGPALTAGFDYDVSPRVVFSTEFRTRWLTTEIESEGSTWATLALNPSTLSAGMGFRF